MDNTNQRLLSELRFWLEIMKEHALFLQLGFPCDETELINTAKQFEAKFAALHQRSLKICPGKELDKLADDALNTTLEFIQFKTLVLDRIITCNLFGGTLFPLLVDHIRREAIRFAVNIIRLRQGKMLVPTEELLENQVFWTRIMADHAKFINHLLDPSERTFIQDTEMFSQTFDMLHDQAEDFSSMLEITPRPIPSLIRYSQQTLKAATDLRNFKAEATKLLVNCELLSIIPPLLADHVRREADRYIFDIQEDLRSLHPGKQPCSSSKPLLAVPSPPTLKPIEENQELIIEKEIIPMSIDLTPHPLYRPQKTFQQPNSTQVKIQFR